jgi:hypothetical protein
VTPKPKYIPDKFPYANATNIIFSNGALDPWWAGGVLPEVCPKNSEVYCLFIDQAAHHLDLRGTDPADPVAVTKAREEEKKIILGWLSSGQLKGEKRQL